MESAKLEVSDRSERGSAAARRMRKAGEFPVNLYGLGREPRAMSASAQVFERIVEKGFHIVELQQENKQQVVLIQDIQYDALGSQIIHADLMRIDREKKVHVHVPVRYIGMAPEMTDSVVDKMLDTINVEVLPMHIPQEFTINLSKVEVGDAVRVNDIEMPEGCAPFDHGDDDIIVINHIKVEAVVEDTDEESDSVEPEVIGAKPDDGDEG